MQTSGAYRNRESAVLLQSTGRFKLRATVRAIQFLGGEWLCCCKTKSFAELDIYMAWLEKAEVEIKEYTP